MVRDGYPWLAMGHVLTMDTNDSPWLFIMFAEVFIMFAEVFQNGSRGFQEFYAHQKRIEETVKHPRLPCYSDKDKDLFYSSADKKMEWPSTDTSAQVQLHNGNGKIC